MLFYIYVYIFFCLCFKVQIYKSCFLFLNYKFNSWWSYGYVYIKVVQGMTNAKTRECNVTDHLRTNLIYRRTYTFVVIIYNKNLCFKQYDLYNSNSTFLWVNM